MKKLKTQRHHWWPKCVSNHWKDGKGGVGWITPDGSCKRVPPNKLGMIGNAHHIKLSRVLGESTPWDTSFEAEFARADDRFPTVIDWLGSLQRIEMFDKSLRERFTPQPWTEEQLRDLTECVVSLAVRSPRNREAVASSIEHFRGPLQTTERNTLIAANMRSSQRIIADAIGARGKYAVLFSNNKEFIYGDGFFHNVTAIISRPHSPKLLAPLTPNMSVIVSKPPKLVVEPQLSTLVLTDEEVELCNRAVQIYSRSALFFRGEQPVIDEVFTCGKHLIYDHPDNPIEALIRSIPGVPDRDRSMDFLGRG